MPSEGLQVSPDASSVPSEGKQQQGKCPDFEGVFALKLLWFVTLIIRIVLSEWKLCTGQSMPV